MLDGYEQITLPTGVVEHKYSVGDAIITKRSNGANETYYLHKDQQGSTTAITNSAGTTVQQLMYDPWGKQYVVNTSLLTYSSPAQSKGYTGHEMVNDFEVIHMGGRTYNPTLGRFMQADPFIQSPTNLQSYNRYAYVFNNPMSYTDPTGYSAWTKFRDKYLKPIVAVAITIYTGGLAAVATSGWAAFGITVAGGAAAGYVSTGSLRGALVGAFSAGTFYGVGSYFDTFSTMTTGLTAAKIGAHGLVGGISNVLSGGKFGHGFMSAGVTQAFAGSNDEIGGKINGKASSAWSDTANRIKRVVAAATVGGTASVVGGGKFGNGALTGAFSRAYNDEAHIQRDNESFLDRLSGIKDIFRNNEFGFSIGLDWTSTNGHSVEYDSVSLNVDFHGISWNYVGGDLQKDINSVLNNLSGSYAGASLSGGLYAQPRSSNLNVAYSYSGKSNLMLYQAALGVGVGYTYVYENGAFGVSGLDLFKGSGSVGLGAVSASGRVTTGGGRFDWGNIFR